MNASTLKRLGAHLQDKNVKSSLHHQLKLIKCSQRRRKQANSKAEDGSAKLLTTTLNSLVDTPDAPNECEPIVPATQANGHARIIMLSILWSVLWPLLLTDEFSQSIFGVLQTSHNDETS